MKILLMRHGYAGDYIGKRDVDNPRRLQPEGKDAVDALVAWMTDTKRAGKYVPNSITCSPIQRAVDTAKRISDSLGLPFVVDQNLEISKPMEMLVKKYAADKSVSRPLIIAHIDNIVPGLTRLNYLDKGEVDPIAMAELRVLKVDRNDGSWSEKLRVLPSDLGCIDFY